MSIQINSPDLWLAHFPQPSDDGHKYDRGHALVVGAPDLTGATRLAASACSRIGAGLVTVVAEERDAVYRTSLPADIMVTTDGRANRSSVTAVLVGPGGMPPSADDALDAIDSSALLVMDADAIKHHRRIGKRFPGRILTPHEGEFNVAFPELTGSRQDRALFAAAQSASVVVLKGSETIIAGADGRLVLNTTASPYLAKAGSGDVLAGMITGLVAQGMNTFDTCCAAVWIHGEIAQRFGPGLIPSDLIDGLPEVLRELLG